VNGVSNQYLRNLAGADQRDWVDCVDPTEFNCNVTMHLATKGSSFEVAYGVDTLQPTNLDLKGAHLALEVNQHGKDLAKKCKQVLSCWWRKPKNIMKSKSLPEDAKWSIKWASKVLLNVNNFILPEGLTLDFRPKLELRVLLWNECSKTCISWSYRQIWKCVRHSMSHH